MSYTHNNDILVVSLSVMILADLWTEHCRDVNFSFYLWFNLFDLSLKQNKHVTLSVTICFQSCTPWYAPLFIYSFSRNFYLYYHTFLSVELQSVARMGEIEAHFYHNSLSARNLDVLPVHFSLGTPASTHSPNTRLLGQLVSPKLPLGMCVCVQGPVCLCDVVVTWSLWG